MSAEEGIKPSHQPVAEVPPPPPAGLAITPALLPRVLAAPGAGLALGLLLGINLFNYIDRQVLSAVLDKVESHFLPENGDWNKTLLGLLTTAFMFSYMIFAPIFGWLADRTRRWWLVGLGVMIWSLASGASGLSSALVGMTGFWLLFLTRCFVGIGEAAYGPVAPAVLSDLYPERIRGQVLSWFNAAIPVGSALGYTLGGLAGWPLSFYLVVPPGLLLGLLCFLMPEPGRGQADNVKPHTVRHTTLKDYGKLFRTPSYVLDTAGMTCLTFALGGIAVWMPTYLEQYRHMGTKAEVNGTFGLIVVVSGLVSTLLGGLAGDWLRKYHAGSYFLISAGAMFLAFPIFILVVFAPSAFLWPLIFLACFLLFFNTGPTNTILANVTHPSLRPAAFALNIFIIHALGDAVSPTVIGFIADLCGTKALNLETNVVESHANLNAGFLAVSGMILVGAVLWLIGARHLGRDTQRAASQLDDHPQLS